MSTVTQFELAPSQFGLTELDRNELTETNGGEPVTLTAVGLWVLGGLAVAGVGYLVGKYLL